MLTDRMFIHTKVFDRLWESLGCSDADLQELQKAICDNPQGHPVFAVPVAYERFESRWKVEAKVVGRE